MTSLSNATSGLQEYITVVSRNQIMWYMEQNKTTEEENKYYASEDYELHLTYLIETWKNLIDEHFVKIDYTYEGTFEELYNYFVETPIPDFNNEWLDDIFVRQILDTNVCLK